ncbi:sensor histidine kinase [Mangrovitalea sediminis]|uniref:sensor histidine kinase n=1 Tax=Mangrovitalea sediminis TaxID=1982043 RepID=UPI000BE5C3EB|nr:ATP-binding protein [Mangrovitalea sediminis]
MALTVLLSIGVVTGGLEWQKHKEQQAFHQSLPTAVKQELQQLRDSGRDHSQRLDEIYDQYWPAQGPGLSVEVISGLALSLLLGLAAAVLSARIFIRPITSVAEAALRISQGDLTARTRGFAIRGELAELSRNFNQMADTLETLERERKDTVAAISHELRTPLTILQGRLHGICDGVIPASDQEHRKLLDQVQHLVRLVDDLNTLALVDANRLSLQCTDLDLGELVNELHAVYADRARDHGVQLEVVVRSLWVHADHNRLRQVLDNLVENGLRYAASGKWLQIHVSTHRDQAVISISDRGPGLPQGIIDRVFDPFFRADNSRSRASGGSGLGLAVARSLIQQQGGSIMAFNREDGGVVFRIEMPLAMPAIRKGAAA